MVNIPDRYEPTVVDAADGRYHPGVRHIRNGRYAGTTIWEYNFYDKRDAWIIAEVLWENQMSILHDIYEQEAKRILSRLKGKR